MRFFALVHTNTQGGKSDCCYQSSPIQCPDGPEWSVEIRQGACPTYAGPKTWDQLRREGYGSIADQLDMIYHGGIEAWAAHIAAVKAQFPKPV